MPHPPTRSYQMRVGLVLLGLLILASGCMAPSLPAIPEATEDHSAHMADGGAAATPLDDTSMMATHEAQMADPAAQATHMAQMADPAAMATHEASMHGTPTPSPAEPVVADGAPLSTFNTADFAGSGLCVLCHEGLFDAAGNDVSITTHWRSTMMANAARDPAWQAKVQSEVARNPALKDVIEEKCAACHVPMAATQAEVEGAAVSLSGDGLLAPDNPLHAAAQDGVSCTLCHQIQPDTLGEHASFSGGYQIDATTEPPDRVAFGPYQNPFGRPMQMHTGYLPAYGEHLASAALCASCHNLFTPFVDAAGVVQGEFPEQVPYTEWEHSSYADAGVTCQTCHMPSAGSPVIISTMPRRLGPREPFFEHHFAGGNALVVGMLRDNAAALEVTADAAHFDATVLRIREQLARAATLTLEESARAGDTLSLTLQVSTATGHKFPTSFPARRAWLHVEVRDRGGNVIFESGRPLPDGAIEGNDADERVDAFEPHYDVITAADQVQVWEPIMGDTDGRVTYTLLRASRYLKDNRLLPAGADKGRLPPDIAVYGAAAQDASFDASGDRVTYQVDLGDAQGPFTVAAELLYQPLSYRFIQDMLADGTEAGAAFESFYSAADKTPQRVAAIGETQVE